MMRDMFEVFDICKQIYKFEILFLFNTLNYYYIVYTVIARLTAASFLF